MQTTGIIVQQDNRWVNQVTILILVATAGVLLWVTIRHEADPVGPESSAGVVASSQQSSAVLEAVDRPVDNGQVDAKADELVAPRSVIAERWIDSELGELRVSPGRNTVEITNGFSHSPSGQTLLKVGGMAASFGFDEDYEAITSSDVGQVAFVEPFAAGHDIYKPGGRANSSIVVIDLGGETRSEQLKTYDFAANIVPEVFTADGHGLFVIDHRPALDPTTYRVRLLDLATGTLFDVDSPQSALLGNDLNRRKLPPLQDMEGVGRRQIGSSSGEFLFTLYGRQPAHHDGTEHGDLHGFVHALSLTERWAVCLDLPSGFGQGDPGTAAITVDPASGKLFVVDSTAQAIVVYDIADLDSTKLIAQGLPRFRRFVDFDVASEAPISALATADALWISEGSQLTAFTHSLDAERRTYETEAPVEALVADSAGRSFAIVDGRLVPLPVVTS